MQCSKLHSFISAISARPKFDLLVLKTEEEEEMEHRDSERT